MKNIKEIEQDLKENLSEFRFQHSMRVAFEAQELAKHYGLDVRKAYLIGLTHDIAREYSIEEMEYWVNKYHLSKELLSKEMIEIAHAEIGAYVVKEKYQFDEESAQAIFFHTLGDKSMTSFDKIIFIADKIGRKEFDKPLKDIKEAAYKDLDKAMIMCLSHQKKRLEKKGKVMHPSTLELLEYLKTHKK